MPFVPFPDCVKVTIVGRLDNQLVENTLGFRSTTGPRSAADLAVLGASLGAWWNTSLVPLMNEGYTADYLQVKGLSSPTPLIHITALSGTAGGNDADVLPSNCTMAVHFSTGLGGRSNHGRNYVPCLSRDEVVGNDIDPAWAQSVVLSYSELVFGGSVLPGGWIWVVLSRITAGEERGTGVFQEVMEVLVRDTIVDSQRRRLPGRGA